MFFIAVLVALIALYFYYHMVHKRRGLPPGPIPLPFFGNILSVMRKPPGEELFAQWRRQYGSVFTYWMGSIPVVFIADHDKVVDVYQKNGDVHSGRPAFLEFEMMIRGALTGLMLIDGDVWKEQRRFSLKVLRDFGVSRNVLQERVLDEILTVFDGCDKAIASGIEEHNLFADTEIAVGSLINSFLFGYRFHGKQRSEFFHLKSLLVDHINAFGHPLVFMSMDNPHFYKNLPFFKKQIQLCTDTATDLMNFFSKQIDEHSTEFNYDKDDFVHAFMNEWRRLDAAGEKHHFSRQQLLSMCYDLWINGQSTISTTISWGCAFLIHNPDVQKKCQEELDRFVGPDRLVTMTDKPNLAYCNATMEEIYRVANITPQVIWHRALEDFEVGGYKLKKNTLTMPQYSSYFIDGEIFKDPYKFNPDRFIDENGNFKKAEQLIPFGIGKRVCMGESLARTEIFLFITNILNRYKLSAGKELPSLKRNHGFAILIEPYLCRVEKRV